MKLADNKATLSFSNGSPNVEDSFDSGAYQGACPDRDYDLFLAVVRSLRGPVFFPLRAVVIAFTDLFRGIPLILVIYLLGFGMPALDLEGVPTSPVFWGVVSLVLVYSAYVAEVYRAGIESIHPSRAR